MKREVTMCDFLVQFSGSCQQVAIGQCPICNRDGCHAHLDHTVRLNFNLQRSAIQSETNNMLPSGAGTLVRHRRPDEDASVIHVYDVEAQPRRICAECVEALSRSDGELYLPILTKAMEKLVEELIHAHAIATLKSEKKGRRG